MEIIFDGGILVYSYNPLNDILHASISMDDKYDKIVIEYSNLINGPMNLLNDVDVNNPFPNPYVFDITHQDLEDVLPTNNIFFRIGAIEGTTHTEHMLPTKLMDGFSGTYPTPKRYNILPSIVGQSNTSDIRQYTIDLLATHEPIIIDDFHIHAIEVWNDSADYRVYFAPHSMVTVSNAFPITRKSYYSRELVDNGEVMEYVSFIGDVVSGVPVRLIIHGTIK